MLAVERGPVNFMGRRLALLLLSGVLVTVSLVSLYVQGLNFGLDFNGGVALQLEVPGAASRQSPLESIRARLEALGYRDASVVAFGSDTDVMVRIGNNDDPLLGDRLVADLRARIDPDITLLGMEYVGPSTGEELRERGGLAMLLALGLVALYITFRFQAKFAAGALLALVHDVIVTLGCFSLSRWEFNLSVLAAILALIGYSINDTIVVFDRIREVFRKARTLDTVQVINTAISSTLDRTLVTSLTTLLVLLAMCFFGGQGLFGFSIALSIGIAVGTYSSIYIASSLLLTLKVQRLDLFPLPERSTGGDAQP